VHPASAQPLVDLIQHAQETAGLHASHVAQAITPALHRLLQTLDGAASRGEQTTVHVTIGPTMASQKRTRKAQWRHRRWLDRATGIRTHNPRLSTHAIAQRIAEETGEPVSTVYKALRRAHA
jgi:hypothetical protein